jgi:hypothetical protein
MMIGKGFIDEARIGISGWSCESVSPQKKIRIKLVPPSGRI